VRRINKLGFDSQAALKEHYGQFGEVTKVLLSNTHEKSEEVEAPFRVRLRPSGLGFVVMRHPELVTAVLAEGETQIVNGVEIQVRKFVSSQTRNTPKDEDEAASIAGSSSCGGHPMVGDASLSSTRCPSWDSFETCSHPFAEEELLGERE